MNAAARAASSIAILCLGGVALAVEPRRITLADAVEIALRVDPLMESAVVDRDRSRLAVLRAQLDRISFRVDGQLQELWNKGNIGGSPIYACMIAGTLQPVDQTTCIGAGGVYGPVPDSAAQGLFNLAGNLQVPLFAGFRIDATVKRAQRSEEAALVQIRRQRRDTALATARAFWQVRRLEMLFEVASSALRRIEESEKVAGARVKAGLAPPIDRNRAVSRRLQQVSSVAEYQGEIEEAIAQLGVSLGIRGAFRLDGGFTFPDRPPPSPEELVDAARRGRPESEAARLQVEIAHQGLRIARSAYYPNLGVFGLFQYGNNQLSVSTGARGISSASAANPFSGLTGTLTLGASLSMNFFDTLHSYTGDRDARYEQAHWVADQKRVLRAIDSDVVGARARVQRLFSRRAPLRDAVEVARDNAKIVEARYKNGEALVIEVLDAQLDLSQAESSLVDVEAQLELAWIELRAALGELPGR
jgi:outer membrane protein TolC